MNRHIFVLFFGMITSGMTQAATIVNGGIIHFRGALVDGGCATNSSNELIASSCALGGKTVQVTQKVVAGVSQPSELPMDLGTVSTKPLKLHPNLLVTTLNYN